MSNRPSLNLKKLIVHSLRKLDYSFSIPIRLYILTQVILPFRLVVSYDLLEDRRSTDVITTKLCSLCFKMAESFEDSENTYVTER